MHYAIQHGAGSQVTRFLPVAILAATTRAGDAQPFTVYRSCVTDHELSLQTGGERVRGARGNEGRRAAGPPRLAVVGIIITAKAV